MESKFTKASLLTDVLSLVLFYIIHVVLIFVAALLSDNKDIPLLIYAVICVIVSLATKNNLSEINNWIARALLSPLLMPYFLARRLRPYTWIFTTSQLLQKMSDTELQELYKRLKPINDEIIKMNDDAQWKNVDFDFLKFKDKIIWGCRTWGEAETLFDHVESVLEDSSKRKV